VRFTDGDIGRTWGAGAYHHNAKFENITTTEAKLICEYRQLAAADADAVVQASFGSGQMTSLVSTFAKAVPVIGANVLGDGTGEESPIYIDLTENAAVENLYVMAHVPRADVITPVAADPKAEHLDVMHDCDRPFPLERIRLEAGGVGSGPHRRACSLPSALR
jgi:hypothetical protein